MSASSNSVTVGPPAQPGSITGSNSVCPSTTGNLYSITAVTGATSYTWAYTGTGATITGGTTATPSIAFSATATAGTLSVTANNTCGPSAQQTLPITINPGTPANPGSITGPTSVCSGVTYNYSIAAITNATSYNWTVPTGWTINPPQTGNSISVIAGSTGQNGTISVTATNGCGTSAPATASTGLINAGAGANNTGIGTGIWTNPGQITSPGDNNYATQLLNAGATTNYLQSSSYGFNIPTNATITGITVVINRDNSGSGAINDNVVKLVNSTGTITGTNFAGGAAQNWAEPNLATATYGSSTNLWGATWTPAIINSPNFGVVVSAVSGSGSQRTLNVDYIQVNVSYTVPSSLAVTVTTNPTVSITGNSSICVGGTTQLSPSSGGVAGPAITAVLQR